MHASVFCSSDVFSKNTVTSARIEQKTIRSDNWYLIGKFGKDTLPISFVEGAGFRQLMAYAEQGYVVRCD